MRYILRYCLQRTYIFTCSCVCWASCWASCWVSCWASCWVSCWVSCCLLWGWKEFRRVWWFCQWGGVTSSLPIHGADRTVYWTARLVRYGTKSQRMYCSRCDIYGLYMVNRMWRPILTTFLVWCSAGFRLLSIFTVRLLSYADWKWDK